MGALLVGAIGVTLLLSACAKQPVAIATDQQPPVTGPQVTERGARGGTTSSSSLPATSEVVTPMPIPPREQGLTKAAPGPLESPLKDIFFDFDRAEIRPDAKAPLVEDMAWLKAHPKAAITIEGHCDERGTTEYNLALGARRARASKDYFIASGIGANRLRTVSYGKERPFVLGHDESAWRWNRRDHFLVTEPRDGNLARP